MYLAELCAISASFCWSLNGIISTFPARKLGAFTFNRMRIAPIFIIFGVYCLYQNLFAGLTFQHWGIISLSGMVGIMIGDTALQHALILLGPRRAGVLFAANAPLSAVLAYLCLGEKMTL